MPLTPADIHNVALPKSPLGRRGYDEEQVDAFLDTITQDMIRLLEENEALRRRVDHTAATGALSTVTGELQQARRACDQAEQNTHRLQARLGEARRAATAAPRETINEGVLALANHTAEQHLGGAQQTSDQLLTEARARSERISAEARQAAHRIEQESRRRHRDAAADLQVRHSALVHEIDELATFAQSYRSALAEHMRQPGI